MDSTLNQVKEYLQELQEAVSKMSADPINDAIEVLLESAYRGRKVFLFGNGGSAATASHFACDLSKNTMIDGAPRLKVIALTDNAALITAWANDTAYDNVFAEQLRPLVEAGDVVIGISCSGNSANVINAMKMARDNKATTIGFTGDTGGQLLSEVDICIKAPSPRIEQQEDIHLILEHSICSTIRDMLQNKSYQLTGDN
jgi:D-sedoheptulose 7-phosphate isomerase